MCDNKYENILVRLNISSLHFRQQHLDVLFLVSVFKRKIVAHSFQILLAYIYLQCWSETALRSVYTVTSRSSPKLDVCLLLM